MQPSTLSENRTLIIVEHMEDYLFEWCLHEYVQMKKYLTGTNCDLAITNSQVMFSYEGQYAEDNKKNLEILVKEFESAQGTTCKLIPESVAQLVETHQIKQPVCMLDMRGQKQLNPIQRWSTLIFGGILGDHPPRDRPAPIRKYFENVRHLGQLQLATDTAVLVSRLILDNKIELQKIPMVDEPTIKGINSKGEKTTVQMEGFSYVSKEVDIQKGLLLENLTKKEKKQIYMSEGVQKLLIEEDLSSQLLM